MSAALLDSDSRWSSFDVDGVVANWIAQYQYLLNCHVVDSISRNYLQKLFDDEQQRVVEDPSSARGTSTAARADGEFREEENAARLLRPSQDLCRALWRTFAHPPLSLPAGARGQPSSLQQYDVEVATRASRIVQQLCEGKRSVEDADMAVDQLSRIQSNAGSFVQLFRQFSPSIVFPFSPSSTGSATSGPVDWSDVGTVAGERVGRPHPEDVVAQRLSRSASAHAKKLQLGVGNKKSYELNHLVPFIDTVIQTSLRTLHRRTQTTLPQDGTLAPPEEDDDVVVVDFGAGQGYLSARLAVQCGYRVVALERNGVQLHGSLLRSQVTELLLQTGRELDGFVVAEEHSKDSEVDVPSGRGVTRTGSLHVANLDISPKTTPQDICNVILEALGLASSSATTTATTPLATSANPVQTPRPMLLAFVSLHACGGLSHDMLRLFTEMQQLPQAAAARCVACVNIGCCYNLILPAGDEREERRGGGGFPMSQRVQGACRRHASFYEGRNLQAAQREDFRHLHITRNMFMTAAQTPNRWYAASRSPGAQATTTTADLCGATAHVRELERTFSSLYLRALVQKAVNLRLGVDDLAVIGRIPAKRQRSGAKETNVECEEDEFIVYATWVLQRVRQHQQASEISPVHDEDERDILRNLYRVSRQNGDKEKLTALWTAKVLVGHPLESLILVDRCWYVAEQLKKKNGSDGGEQEKGQRWNIALVPVFDVRESPRNLSVVCFEV